tara:strand:- start:93 stop:386 length:294 start_codon:yes stop_codon:yes gene_type:complete
MFKRIEAAAYRSLPVTIHVNHKPVEAFAGESVATALSAAGILHLRNSPGHNAPRGAFCLMGVCQECKVRIDSRLITACQEPVRDGLKILLEFAHDEP